MPEDIQINGIQTNNLKNISIILKKNAINLIIGPSGSGKSSLAYDTIAQIGMHELGAMYFDEVNEPEYQVQSFSNMVVTVPIKQLNSNNNVRSTIGTYFSLNPLLAKVFSSLLEISYDYFVLNKTENVCPFCMGIGYVKKIDANKIIDYNKKIKDVPIKCWSKNKDFYRQIIQLYCEDNGIPITKTFRQLPEDQKQQLLYGTSTNKYKIRYKVTNHESTRTTQYFGPMTEVKMLKSYSPSSDFYSELQCDKCNSEKFENGHRDHKLCGLSIGEVMLLSFNKIEDWISKVRRSYDCSYIDFSLSQLEAFSRKATELNLGYIFINRTIPSLSGGELQRLRLIQVFSSQLTDLLIILDEPLSGLSGEEKDIIYKNILSLVHKHTLLIVDHHEKFLDVSKNTYALGEGSGKNGGNLIDTNKYLLKQKEVYKLTPLPITKIKHIKLISKVYNYKGVVLDIAENRLNIISGSSGIGKSTLLREYLPQFFDSYLYINQKPLSGNNRSTVATNLDVANKIIQGFAREFKQPNSFFSNTTSAEGTCRTCLGSGILSFGAKFQSQVLLECKDCNGTGFDKKLMKYRIDGQCIHDVWKMTIDEASHFYKLIDNKIYNTFALAQSLLLGHLQVGEKMSDLSGGENLRLKLMKSFSTNKNVLGIDEPFKGLNNQEIYTISKSFAKLIDQGKTIIAVDHEDSGFKYFTKHIKLINKDGVLTDTRLLNI